MARTRANVEIARTGTYRLASGEYTFTRRHLAAAVEHARAGTPPRLAIGHVDPRFRTASGDGEPAIGRVENLRLAEDGELLVGDYVDVPDWLDQAIEAHYPGRSIEGTATGDDLRIDAVALLGVTRPGIHTLADLRSFVEDGPALVAAGPDNRGEQITVLLTAAGEPPVRADEEETPPMAVDTTLLRQHLGLPEDATEDQINEALAAPAEATAVEPEAETRAEAEVVELPQPAAEVEEAPAEPVADPIAASAARQVADLSSEVAELRAAEQAREQRETTERRDGIIASAVREGRISPADRDHYRGLLDVDEARATELIQARARGTVPLAPVGDGREPVSASADGISDAAYAAYMQSRHGIEVS